MTRSVFSRKYDVFRALLVDARKARGLTQTQVAKKLRRPQSFVSKYEQGERRLDVVEFLEVAKVLDLSPEKVLQQIEEESGCAKGKRDP